VGTAESTGFDGAQSFDPGELEGLGRIHAAGRPAEAFALARSHGFRRLSLDLMFGFPGHSAETWAQTLQSALALEPEHLSAYCFIPEPGTPLGDAARTGVKPPLSPERQADLYETLVNRLVSAGYALYETSNFSRPGGECRHNLVYWLRRDYLGLGPSAHGFGAARSEVNHYALGTADALSGASLMERRRNPAVRAGE
jgi:oxygen-independent coproporphyrinogen-3 oxidase